MKIVFTETFKKSYSKLPSTIKRKFDQKLKFFIENPSHPSLNLHRINDYWEFYIDKRYRCILKKDDDTYSLVSIGGHDIIDKFRYTLRQK
jgi:mRNA-degrading endonuclease RelE of RelBE toxin-antitoxin system